MVAATHPRVAVVVPTWNGRELLGTLMPSLAAQRFTDFEVVVVDNGSSDGSRELIAQSWPDVRLIALAQNIGFAAAVNRGIASTRSQYVALVNNDIELDPDWLGALVAALDADPRAASAACKLLSFHDRAVLDGAGDELTWSGVARRRGFGERDTGQYETGGYVFSACAGAALYRRSAFERVGLFDEDFFAYFEDVDWGFRAQLAGYRCRYVPTAVAYHMAAATTDRSPGLGTYLRARNRIALVLKNFPLGHLVRHAPDLLLEEIMGCVAAARDGHAALVPRALSDAVRALPRTLRKRREIQRRRAVAPHTLDEVISAGTAGVAHAARHLRRRALATTGPARQAPALERAPAIAVVVVAYGEGDHLAEAAKALAAQTLRPARVIVVDNGCPAGAIEAVRRLCPGVEVLRPDSNVGFAAGCNAGVAAAADCELIALLNSDAVPEPGWLAALARAARDHPTFAAFGSRLVRATAPNELDGTGDVYHVSGLAWRRDHRRALEDAGDRAGEVFSVCAAAALYRRDAFLEVGGFDESYFCFFEDTDLAFRMRLAGLRCWYEPRAVARHVGSATAGADSDFTVYHSQRNLVWTYLKNMPAVLLFAYLPQHLLMNVLAVGWFSMRGQARPVLAAKRDAIRGVPAVVRRRRTIHAARRVGALELLRTMARGRGAYITALRRAYATAAAARCSHPPGWQETP
jgi:GT2 family glycosyltransferase